MYLLPKDLNQAILDMEKAILANLNSSNSRLTIEYKFEGIKFNNIAFKIYKLLETKRKVFLVFSDAGAVALAQRDYKTIKENIFTFKSFNESKFIADNNSVVISIIPQPYDFETFESMCENFMGLHISINPKFEDASIGIGSVVRERRKNFQNTWINIYYIQPLEKGALMHVSPDNWSLFKEQNNMYTFIKDFETKPDNETIFVNL